jgi:hypothetical protein
MVSVDTDILVITFLGFAENCFPSHGEEGTWDRLDGTLGSRPYPCLFFNDFND